MKHKDKLSAHHKEILDGSYDCVDRLVLNGYYPISCSPMGFWTWFIDLKGSDNDLNNKTLMRMAGRFSSRINAFCKKKVLLSEQAISELIEKVNSDYMRRKKIMPSYN